MWRGLDRMALHCWHLSWLPTRLTAALGGTSFPLSVRRDNRLEGFWQLLRTLRASPELMEAFTTFCHDRQAEIQPHATLLSRTSSIISIAYETICSRRFRPIGKQPNRVSTISSEGFSRHTTIALFVRPSIMSNCQWFCHLPKLSRSAYITQRILRHSLMTCETRLSRPTRESPMKHSTIAQHIEIKSFNCKKPFMSATIHRASMSWCRRHSRAPTPSAIDTRSVWARGRTEFLSLYLRHRHGLAVSVIL